MPAVAQAIVWALEAYLVAGAVSAVAFVIVGVNRTMPDAHPITLGARMIILPAAILLWPWILRRWAGVR